MLINHYYHPISIKELLGLLTIVKLHVVAQAKQACECHAGISVLIPQGFFTLMNLFVLRSFTHMPFWVGTSCKSQDSLLHLCVNQSWGQRSPSPNWKKLCVPDAELDSMKVSFCQIRATDQKAYFMIKLLILCMHVCMYIRYKFFLGMIEKMEQCEMKAGQPINKIPMWIPELMKGK